MAPSNLAIIPRSLMSESHRHRSLTLGHIQRDQVTPKERLLSLAGTPTGPALAEEENSSVRRSSCSQKHNLVQLLQCPHLCAVFPGTQDFCCISSCVSCCPNLSLPLLPSVPTSPIAVFLLHPFPFVHLVSLFFQIPYPSGHLLLFAAFLHRFLQTFPTSRQLTAA